MRSYLSTLRSVISQYTLDKQKAPQSLDDIVTAGYLRQIPVDPMTKQTNWEVVQEDLLLAGMSARTERVVPVVLFYNKRDLPDVMPVEYMDATFGLRTWKVPRLSGSALTGLNVLKAADLITSNLMRQLAEKLGLEDKEE